MDYFQEADRSNRETIEELEEEVRSLQEKMRVMEGGEEERLNKIADLQSEKAKFEQKRSSSFYFLIFLRIVQRLAKNC